MTWRGWLGFAGSASAVVLISRNLWVPAAVVGAGVLVLAVLFVRAEMAAAKAEIREAPEPEFEPEPEPEPAPVSRAVWRPRPPWDTAALPVLPSVPCERSEVAGRHRRERGLREAVAGALRTARQTYLP